MFCTNWEWGESLGQYSILYAYYKPYISRKTNASVIRSYYLNLKLNVLFPAGLADLLCNSWKFKPVLRCYFWYIWRCNIGIKKKVRVHVSCHVSVKKTQVHKEILRKWDLVHVAHVSGEKSQIKTQTRWPFLSHHCLCKTFYCTPVQPHRRVNGRKDANRSFRTRTAATI